MIKEKAMKNKNSEHVKERVAAQRYAFKFLAKKYHEEYRELYRAYLVNRGISTRSIDPMVDERELTKG
jgi:hypothetical protein